MSDSSQVQLYYIVESTWGTTPASALTELRFTGEDLNYDIGTIQSDEIRSDRQVTDLIQTTFQANGGANMELSYATFDSFFESALFGAWGSAVAVALSDVSCANADNSYNTAAGDFVAEGIVAGQWLKVAGFTDAANNGYAKVVSVTTAKLIVSNLTLADEAAGDSITMGGTMLRNGVTQKSFTLEKKFNDITQFISYTGMVVNQFNLAVNAQSVITGGFQFVGKSGTIAQTTVGTGSPTAANSNAVMNSGAHVGSIREAGSEVTSAYVMDIAFNVNNNLRDKPAVAVIGSTGIGAGQCVVTGTLTAYFEDETLYEKYINNTATSIDFRVTDGSGNTYIFTFPNVKFSSGTVTAGGNNQDVMVNLGFQAIRDATTDCTIQIDKM